MSEYLTCSTKLTGETWQDSCVTLNGNGSAIFTGIARKAPGWESGGKDCLRLRYKDLLDSRKRQKPVDDDTDLRILYQVFYNYSMPSHKSVIFSFNLAKSLYPTMCFCFRHKM